MVQPTHGSGPYPFVSVTVAGVVFIGGSVGTGIRYAMASLPVLGTQGSHSAGSFHLGTFLVNMIACFCYAMLVSYLAQAPWILARHRELISRGFGMGVCGGLSTLSALALEVFSSLQDRNIIGASIYIVLTFVAGFACALGGVRLSTWLLDHHQNLGISSDEQTSNIQEAR
ncbi:MAG: CrcB family protein [Bifidobacterium sp.]|nr:CrcB family protein [Bifidobacterium sp.]MCH4174502.1 CrcB family protein [Bifidobacterium sp.]